MQTDLSILYSVTKQFFDTWKSEDWNGVLQAEITRLNAPCTNPNFSGECMFGEVFCPLSPECALVYEVEQTLYRTKLDEVMEAFTKREQDED